MKSKQVLDVQQMQHLQELGLDTSNASMCRIKTSNGKGLEFNDEWISRGESLLYPVPAYTLQDVLDALTKRKINDGFCSRIIIDLSRRFLSYHYKDKQYVKTVMKSFDCNGTGCLIDAAYEMLCWSIRKNFIKTDKKINK